MTINENIVWKTVRLPNHQQYEVSSQRKMTDGYRSIKLGCTETKKLSDA
jgi:hypothetical protein